MTGDFRRLLRGVEGEGPSPAFREQLRAQIVAETEDIASGDEDVVVLDLTSSDSATAAPTAKPRFGLLVACAAAVMAIAGIWVSLATNDEPPVDVTTEAPEDDEDTAAIETLTTDNTPFEPGTFRIDTLGTPFTFEVEEQTGARLNDNGTVALAALPSANADDRTITFRRTNLIPDPTEPTTRLDPGSGWPATDLDGWLARLDRDVVAASDPAETTLGGLRATVVELTFACDAATCSAGDLLTDPGLPIFTPGSTYRLWVVDQGDQDPIVVTVAVGQGGDLAWFDTADTILDSVDFEAIEPNPVQQRPAGPVEVDAFDGIRLELPDEATVVEPYGGFARIIPEGFGSDGDLEFLTRPLDAAGSEIISTDQLLALLANEAVAVAELEPVTMNDQETRVFSVNSGSFPSIVLQTRPEDLARDESGWESPRLGQLWVTEHPERGLLILSAESFGNPAVTEPLISWGTDLVASLEFR